MAEIQRYRTIHFLPLNVFSRPPLQLASSESEHLLLRMILRTVRYKVPPELDDGHGVGHHVSE